MKAHVEQALACGGFSLRHLRTLKHPLQAKACSTKDTLG